MRGLRSNRVVAKLATAIVLLGVLIKPSCAADGRIHITFIKSHSSISGSGSLFYQAHRYPISVDGIDISKFNAPRIDLVGTVSHLQSPSDVPGLYVAGDHDSAVIHAARVAILKNKKGVLMELHNANIGTLVLDLDNLTVTGRGWPSE